MSQLQLEVDHESSALTGTADRRAWRRYDTEGSISLEVLIPSLRQRVKARVVDISQGGVRFLCNLAVELGAMIRVMIPGSGKSHSEVMACVMHSTVQANGEWILGCTFCAELADDDLSHLGARKQLSTRNDQRLFERYPVKGHAWVAPVSHKYPSETEGSILNISPTGIGLLTEQQLEPGCLLNVRLTNEQGKSVITLLASVVYLHTEENKPYTIGCNFIRELTEKELRSVLE